MLFQTMTIVVHMHMVDRSVGYKCLPNMNRLWLSLSGVYHDGHASQTVTCCLAPRLLAGYIYALRDVGKRCAFTHVAMR